jgi:predicted tellurium resistance membrane protein TerC
VDCLAQPRPTGRLMKAILGAVFVIAFTDVTLQLDNALAISSVASQLPSSQRFVVLAAGVLVAAICLLTFTIIGSAMVERLTWLKPVAGVVLLGIGAQMIWGFFRP